VTGAYYSRGGKCSQLPQAGVGSYSGFLYTEIALHDNVVVPPGASRAVLAGIGLAGEILHTPGHSDDSVSVLLDDGSAFTGDLTHPAMFGEDDASAVAAASWRMLRQRGATRVYPGRDPVRALS
jgi:ribonuclease/clavin/mitogillin